jgi:CRISPR-associated protein Cas1
MGTLYLTQPGSKLTREGEALKVIIPGAGEQDPPRKVTLPLQKITQVIVLGNITLTTPVLQTLLERNVGVTYLTGHGRFLGQLGPALSRNGQLRLAQHQAHHVPVRRMTLAQTCVRGKLHNMRVLLMRSGRKQEEQTELDAAIQILQRCEKDVQMVTPDNTPPPDPQHPQTDSTWGTVLGLEGTGSAAYFKVFGLLLREPTLFNGRQRRPPTDPVNALLSFAYTLLHQQVLGAVQSVGLDPYVGFLHGTQYGKPALSLDLMEEMRPVLADSVVLTVINKRILTPEDFEEELGAYRLTDGGRRRFLEQWESRLETEICHPIFNYRVTYRRALELQARLLARWLLAEIPTYPPLLVR